MKIKKLFIFFLFILILFIFGNSVVLGTKLYNFQNNSIIQKLENLNDKYQINLDIVILNFGDKCQNKENFIDCSLNEYGLKGSDIAFVINIPKRRMETSVRESLNTNFDIFTKYDALNLEKELKDYLRKQNLEGAINKYIILLQEKFNKQCKKINIDISECNIPNIKKKLKELEKINKENEIINQKQRMEEQRKKNIENAKIVKNIVKKSIKYSIILFTLGILFYIIYSVINYQKNKKELYLIQKNINFYLIELNNDKDIFKKEKNKLIQEFEILLHRIEDIISMLTIINSIKTNKKLKNNNYEKQINNIIDKYNNVKKKSLKSKNLIEEKSKIKNINL